MPCSFYLMAGMDYDVELDKRLVYSINNSLLLLCN